MRVSVGFAPESDRVVSLCKPRLSEKENSVLTDRVRINMAAAKAYSKVPDYDIRDFF